MSDDVATRSMALTADNSQFLTFTYNLFKIYGYHFSTYISIYNVTNRLIMRKDVIFSSNSFLCH